MSIALRGTADWFGVSKDGDATQKWQRKSLRHCSLRYGKLKPQVIREMELPSQDNISLTSTETPPPLYVPSSQHGMQKVPDVYQCWRSCAPVSLFNHAFFLPFFPDCGPVGSRTCISYGGGGRWIQCAPNAHHARCCVHLLLQQLAIRPEPHPAPTQARVCGQNELQGSGSSGQGEHMSTYYEALL